MNTWELIEKTDSWLRTKYVVTNGDMEYVSDYKPDAEWLCNVLNGVSQLVENSLGPKPE